MFPDWLSYLKAHAHRTQLIRRANRASQRVFPQKQPGGIARGNWRWIWRSSPRRSGRIQIGYGLEGTGLRKYHLPMTCGVINHSSLWGKTKYAPGAPGAAHPPSKPPGYSLRFTERLHPGGGHQPGRIGHWVVTQARSAGKLRWKEKNIS